MLEDKISVGFIEHVSGWFGHTNQGLSKQEIKNFCNKYSVKFNVNLESSVEERPYENKASFFARSMHHFNSKQQYLMIMELCNMDSFADKKETKEIQSLLIERYGHFAPNLSAEIDDIIISETKHFLDSHPDAKEAYENALAKYKANSFERNLVDDLRLAYELLLKSIFKNDKPLEKQQNEIVEYLKSKGFPDEFIAMYNKMREYYCTFQNRYAKHNDKVEQGQIVFLIELTSVLMKFLLRKQ